MRGGSVGVIVAKIVHRRAFRAEKYQADNVAVFFDHCNECTSRFALRIRVEHIGDLAGLPEDVRNEIINAKKDTEHFTGTTCVLAINYGSRDEIVRGVKKLIMDGVSAENINEDTVSSALDIPSLPPVDLMIRTGGEERLSNFLLWQCAYAEFVFTDTLWPDYNEDEFFADIEKFQRRNRRFGAVPNQ